MFFLEEFSRLLDSKRVKFKKIVASVCFSEQEISGGEVLHALLIQHEGRPAIALLPSDRVLDFPAFDRLFGYRYSGVLKEGFCSEVFRDADLAHLPIFIDSAVACETVSIYHESPYFSIEVRLADVLNRLGAVSCPCFAPKKYKVRPKTVSPSWKREGLFNAERVVLGVSLENDKFCGEKLKAQLHWVAGRFEHCTLLLGDWMHHHTVRMNEDCDEAQALARAEAVARDKTLELEALLQKIEGRCQFELLPGSEVVTASPDYPAHRRQLEQLLEQCPDFACSARHFAASYVSRRDQPLEAFYAHSSAYLLDELALFASLSQQGYRVFIYPGAMAVFHEMSCGLHPQAPEPLHQLVSVELKFTSNAQHNRAASPTQEQGLYRSFAEWRLARAMEVPTLGQSAT